jgi:putative ABC transport system substrate-binding protein
MNRREFTTLLGGAAAGWPLAARAQRAMPVIGLLIATPSVAGEKRMTAFRQGLMEAGYVAGRNVSIVSMEADGVFSRLPVLAAELVQRPVDVIVSPVSSLAALAARDATKAIPIVFSVSTDPVALGLVATLARPGGNVTGVNTFSSELSAKRLGLLRELLPGIKHVAALHNPISMAGQWDLKALQAAAAAVGLELSVGNAGTSAEIDAAYAMLARQRPDALLVVPDPLFSSRRTQLVLLAARYALPAIYSIREYAEVGGLMSYSTNIADAYRQLGAYAGRVLKGDKPAELPVVQSTKFELIINLQAARAISLGIPPTLIARADEVIE